MPKDKDHHKRIHEAKAAHEHEQGMARMQAAKKILDGQKDRGLALGQTLMSHGKSMVEQHKKRVAARHGRQP